jgi:hypothetical protein
MIHINSRRGSIFGENRILSDPFPTSPQTTTFILKLHNIFSMKQMNNILTVSNVPKFVPVYSQFQRGVRWPASRVDLDKGW